MIKAISTKEVNIKKLNPAEYNPRKILRIGDKGYDKLKNSLLEFGEVLPIVWNEQTGNIVGGHQRYYIYLDQGIKSLIVSVVDLSLEKEKALNITLNNHKVGSEWDYDKLSLLIGELETPDLHLTGFDEDELSNLIGSLNELSSIDSDSFNELESISGGSLPVKEPEQEKEEEAPAPTVTVLPDGDEPSTDGLPKDVYFKLGKYEFMISRSIYDAWNYDLKQHSDDMEETIDEIKIRLGL